MKSIIKTKLAEVRKKQQNKNIYETVNWENCLKGLLIGKTPATDFGGGGGVYTNLRQNIQTLRGGARAEKMQFLVKIFQKLPKNAIFGLFFKILPAAQKNWSNRFFILIRESSENQFGRPEKKVKKNFEIF